MLEKIAPAGKLNIVLGEKGLTDRVVNLLQSVKLQSVAKAQEAGNNLGLLGFLFLAPASSPTASRHQKSITCRLA